MGSHLDVNISNERYRVLVDSIKDYAIFLLTPEGRVATWNEGARRTKGYTADEIIGKSIELFYTEPDRQANKVRYLLAKAVKEGRVEDEGWRVRKDGTRFWADVIITPIFDAQGNLTGYSKVTRDLSPRKQAEDHIRLLNQKLEAQVSELGALNKELESFSYSVSHDLRAPVRHIGSFATLLQQHSGALLDDTGSRYLKTIIKSAKRMGRLVDELLDFARIGRSVVSKSRIPMNPLISVVRGDLKPETEGRHLTWTVDPLPDVIGDPAMLRQVLVNLISNAVKYTRHKPRAAIHIGTLPRTTAEEVVFFVRDNGAGFDMKYVDKLFGVFQRLHSLDEFEGTGIGLASVERIIGRHGGRVWAEGVPNEGATFYFSLPTRDSTDKKS